MKKYKLLIVILIVFSLIGCSYFAPKLHKIDQQAAVKQEQVIESVRIHNDVIDQSLTLNTNKNPYTDLAHLSSENIGDLLGPPKIENQIDIKPLFPTDTKLSVSQVIRKQLVEKQLNEHRESDKRLQNEIIKLEGEKAKLEEKLQAYGTKYEQERNQRVWWKFWTFGTTGFVIAGLIALCVFFPPAIPIILGALKWIFSKFVGLVNYVVPALANTIRGIGEARKTLKVEAETNKSLPEDKKILYTPDEVLELIDTELAKSQNTGDKTLVEKIRKKVNV